MKNKIPKLKKKINAFLVEEEGKISKQSLLKTGILLTTAAVGTAVAAKKVSALHTSGGTQVFHDNGMAIRSTGHSVSANHGHHGSHASHGSHSSHGSHGQW